MHDFAQISVDNLLPQRPPVLLLDKVLAYDRQSITCRISSKRVQFFLDANGRLLLTALPEMVAQAAAVMNGLLQLQAGENFSRGLVAAIKNFCFYASPQDCNSLQVYVRIDSCIGNHQVVVGEIYQREILVARGSVFLFLQS